MNDPSAAEYSDWRQAMASGNHCMRQGDLAGALQAFDAAVRQWPEEVGGWINLGSTLIQCKQYAAAANVMSQAVERAPDNALCFTVLGDATRMLGRRKAARRCYEEALRLERSPENLNRLGLLRGTMGELDAGLAMLDEALASKPDFTLARINRATLLIENRAIDAALSELHALDPDALLPPERQVLDYTLSALGEYARLNAAIGFMLDNDDVVPLAEALRELPAPVARLDRAALTAAATYARRVREFTLPDNPLDTALPDDWALIEALHMIPHVHSVDEFLAVRDSNPGGAPPGSDLSDSLAMAPAIRAAQACREAMFDPPLAEAHLRHWHGLSSRDNGGFMPGHFKYTQNGTARNPLLQRVKPALASSSVQCFIREVYPKMAPGFERAMIAFLTLMDLHPFADGNGRVGMTWLNRELIWAGQMPALFARENSLKGALGDALRDVRNNGGDLTPMIAAISAGQEHAGAFLAELAQR